MEMVGLGVEEKGRGVNERLEDGGRKEMRGEVEKK